MARKIHLSFLGTTNYISCNYYYKDKENRVEKVRFAQEASIRLMCSDYSAKDQVYVFATETSCKKNWEDNGHEFKGKIIECEGLAARLSSLGLPCPVDLIKINNGVNEEGIWAIFKTIFDLLEPDDELIFDITYGFRSFPMLGMVLINYAKTIKNIKVKSICYAGIEVLTLGGKPLYKIPAVERNAPLIELASFSVLQDWTNAAQDFLVHGNSKKIEELTSRAEINNLVDDNEALKKSFKAFNKSINNTTLSIATVRGKSVIDGQVFQDLIKAVDEIQDTDLIAPLEPLLRKIKEKVGRFHKNSIKNIFYAAEWCDEHNLVQQGITFLQVFIILYILDELDKDLDNKNMQDLLSSALALKDIRKFRTNSRMSIDEKEQIGLAKEFHASSLVKEFRAIYYKINNSARNDINHGGLRKEFKKPIALRSILKSSVKKTKEIIRKY